jgi:nucleoside-diphosphate-sugar epimerase
MKTKRHLVTGGSGFLGNLIARRLYERGERVRVFDTWHDATQPQGIEFIPGDVRDSERVGVAMRGVTTVHHTAALVPLTKAGKDFWSVNVDGSRTVAQTAVDCGVERFIHLSSSAVYGAPEACPVDEDTQFAPVDDYGRSKLEGENVVRDECRRGGVSLIVVRPRTILGAGRLGIFQVLFEWIREGRRVPIIGDGNQMFQFIHAHDLVDAYELIMTVGVTGSYNVGTDRFGTMRQAIQGVIDHAQSKSIIVSLPVGPAIVALKVLDRLHLSPLAPWHYLTSHKAFHFDTAPLRRLSWSPCYSNDEMLRESWDWFAANWEIERGRRWLAGDASPHRRAVGQRLLGLARRFA